MNVGDRVVLTDDVDRYPNFIAPRGAKGTVTMMVNEPGADLELHVRLDEHLPGAEEWDNEVIWTDGDLLNVAAELALDGTSGGVMQSWTHYLPLRAQGTLLTGIRGCDVAPKNPLDAPERDLVSFLRWCTMVPADPREVDFEPGAFFRSRPPASDAWKPSDLGHYPLHWYAHLMHCFEVVGYWHPVPGVKADARVIYARLARALHLEPETETACRARLTEDRIAQGSVVS